MGYTLSADVEHKVIEDVLKSYLKEDDLNSAIHLWDQQYHGQPLDKLSFFVFEIATTSTLRTLRKDILKELEIQLKTTSEQDTQKAQSVASNSSSRPKFVPKSKQLDVQKTDQGNNQALLATKEDIEAEPIVEPAVLSELISLLKTGLANIDVNELSQVLNEYLDESGLPSFIAHEVNGVILSAVKLEMIPHDVSHIRKLINILYGILCEYHGPVKVDRLMTKSMLALEQKYPLENLRQFL